MRGARVYSVIPGKTHTSNENVDPTEVIVRGNDELIFSDGIVVRQRYTTTLLSIRVFFCSFTPKNVQRSSSDLDFFSIHRRTQCLRISGAYIIFGFL